MAINFDQDRGSLLGINNNNINSNQMAFLPEFLENLFLGNPESIQLGEEGSPIDKAKDALEENKQKSLPSAEDVLKGNVSSLGLPSDNLTAMAIANYDNLFAPKTLTDAFGVKRTVPGLDKPEDLYTGKFNVIDGLPNDGITKNVRFRDMLLQDLKNLPSDIRTSLGTVKKGLAEDFGGLKDVATNIKNKGIDLLGSGKELVFKGIGSLFGGPVGSFIGGALANLKETPEQKAIRNFYEQKYGLTDTGQVASGIMQGYNPVYGFGGAGLQGAIDKRLATILKTEEDKKKKGLKLSQELINRRRELEALKRQEEQALAATLSQIGKDEYTGPGKAFAPRQDTFTKGKTVTLSDGRQYSSPR